MNTQEFQQEVEKQNQAKADQAKGDDASRLAVQNTQAVIDTIANATKTILQFHAQHQPKVSVTNQQLPTTIKTPDVKQVVDALTALKPIIQETKPDHTKIIEALNTLNESIAKLPTVLPQMPEMPEPVEAVTVKNQPDYKPDFERLTEAVGKIEVNPVVNVKTPAEKPDDYTPIVNALSDVLKAVRAIKLPEAPITDLTPIVEATSAVQRTIEGLRFPIANYVLPFINTEGEAKQAPIPLVDVPFDYVGFTNDDGNGNYQTISFNTGGSGGTLVRTLDLTYDANNNVTSITRS